MAAQHVNLGLVVHHMPQVEPRAPFQIALFKHTFEQQQRTAPTGFAQDLCFVQVQQGKTVSRAQGFVNPGQAMAIGIGFDDRPDPRITGGTAQARQIVLQGLGMNDSMEGTRHGGDCRRAWRQINGVI